MTFSIDLQSEKITKENACSLRQRAQRALDSGDVIRIIVNGTRPEVDEKAFSSFFAHFIGELLLTNPLRDLNRRFQLVENGVEIQNAAYIMLAGWIEDHLDQYTGQKKKDRPDNLL